MRLRVILGPFLALSGSVARAEDMASDLYAMISPLHRGGFQNYATQGRECEAAVFSLRGNQDYAKPKLTVEIKAQGGGVQCRQALNEGGLVLGMTYQSSQIASDGVIFRNEYFSTSTQPSLMYALGSMVTLGFTLDFDNTEVKTTDERYATSRYNSELSLSLHESNWEFTVVSGDRWRSNEHPEQDVPRHLLLQAVARPFPFFGLGLHIDRVDYAGVVVGEDTRVQSESTFGVVLTSRVLGAFSLEAVADMVSAAGGDPDTKGKSLEGLLGYRFNQSIKMAVTMTQYSSENEDYRLAMTHFAMSVGAMF